jgi:predicted transcriptional regulator
MRIVTAWATTVLLLALGDVAAGFDCERVRALEKEGKRASEIARALEITTPDVQHCLAGEMEEPSPARQEAPGLPLVPARPETDAAVPRPRND